MKHAPLFARRAETRTFRFNHLAPTQFVTLVSAPQQELIPKDIVSLSPNDIKRELVVAGERGALDTLRKIVALLDVRTRELVLELRVLDGNVVRTTSVVQLKNNEPTVVTMIGQGVTYRVNLTAHINGDSSLSLAVDATPAMASGEKKFVRTNNQKAVTFTLTNGVTLQIIPTLVA